MTVSLTVCGLANWLADIVANFVDIDGRIFIDRDHEGLEALRRRAATHGTLREAQRWMNIVLIESFLDEAIGEGWETDDPSLDEILAVYAKAWTYQMTARYPDAVFEIVVIKDDEDVGLLLTQP